MVKRPFAIISLLALVGAGCAGPSVSPSQPTSDLQPKFPVGQPTTSTGPTATQTWDVSIADFLYTQNTLTVKRGDRIAFTNRDAVDHSASADGGAFDTGIIAPEATAVIDTSSLAPGAYGYHCVVHTNMKGTLIIE